MAYWWVSQEEMYRTQRAGHYLWAPLQNPAGQSYFHWRNIAELLPGDVVFSYGQRRFQAVAIVRSEPYEAPRPPDLDFPESTGNGRRVDVNYRDINPPSPLSGVLSMVQPLLPHRQSPLRPDGSDYPGYLFALPGRAGRMLLDYLGSPLGQTGDEAVSPVVLTTGRDMTERRALAASRLGLGDFRKAVFEMWEGECVITRSRLFELLRARHIKPWRDSNNEERLDPHNGLLLSPLYDAAFAAGLITFDSGGRLILSSTIHGFQWDLLSLRRTAWLAGLRDEHQPYLAYHREHVFLGNNADESGINKLAPFAIP